MEVIVAKKNVILDATLLSGMSCGRFFDLRYNHHLVQRGGRSNSLEAGSVVHKILDTYNKAIINRIKKTDAIGFGLAAGQKYISGCVECAGFKGDGKPKCGHEPDEFPGVHNLPMDNQGYQLGWKWVLETMEQYFAYYKDDFWIPLESEVTKRAVVYEDDSIRIMWKAKLDEIVDTNQAILPMDHKTAKQRRETLDLSYQFMGQCFLMGTRQVIVNKIGFQQTLRPEEKFTRPILTYTADRMLEWQGEIIPYYAYRLLEYQESGYWPPDYTKCEGKFGNCVFIDVCKADRHRRMEEINIGFEQGRPWDIGNEGE